jgi:hypothetical protein
MKVDNKGISFQIADPNQKFMLECVVSRSCFEFDEDFPDEDDNINTFNFDIPIRFDVWQQLIMSFQKGALIKFWIKTRYICAIYPKTKDISELAKVEDDEIPILISQNTINKIFPLVTHKRFEHSLIVTKSEFSHQIEHALISTSVLHIAVCARYVIFYSIDSSSEGWCIIPSESLSEYKENHLYNQGFVTENAAEFKQKHIQISSGSRKFNFEEIDAPVIVQAHSFRYISTACRSKLNCENIVLALSEQNGLIITIPITGYGCSDTLTKDSKYQAYFRYRCIPILDEAQIQAPPIKAINELRMKFKSAANAAKDMLTQHNQDSSVKKYKKN